LQINLFVWDPTEPIATRPLFTLRGTGYKFFYTFDGNKNVSELVHFETRNGIAAHYDYAPFGAVTRAISASAVADNTFTTDNPFRFSSEYHDDTLGLVYYNYRHYNPIDGRWCGRDPVGENDEQMLYLFVANCSITEVDILGLWDNPQGIVDAFNGPSPDDAYAAYVESLLPPKPQSKSKLNLPVIDFSSMIGYKGVKKSPLDSHGLLKSLFQERIEQDVVFRMVKFVRIQNYKEHLVFLFTLDILFQWRRWNLSMRRLRKY
jgi:RHS repeat-associated protein